jgi:hypothetical protein
MLTAETAANTRILLPGQATEQAAAEVGSEAGKSLIRGIARLRAFSGKVDTGFPSENAINKEQLEHFPIQPDREAL